MANQKLKLEIDMNGFEGKLKIYHKHIGNLLADLESICNECGSTNTENNTTYSGDGIVYYEIKACRECGESETVSSDLAP